MPASPKTAVLGAAAEPLWLLGTPDQIALVESELPLERARETLLLPEQFEYKLGELLPYLAPLKGKPVFVAVGPRYLNALRMSLVRTLNALRVRFESIVSPAARVSPGAIIGKGVFIGPGCAVGTGVVIEDFCVLEEACRLGRGSALRKYTWLRFDCTVAPQADIGARCLVGPSVNLFSPQVGADCEISVPGNYSEPIASQTHYLAEAGGPILKIS